MPREFVARNGLIAEGDITASGNIIAPFYFGTASFALNGSGGSNLITGSIVPITASYALSSLSSLEADISILANNSISASYSSTASFIIAGGGSNLITGSLVPITASQSVTSSFNTQTAFGYVTDATSSNWITASFLNPNQQVNLTSTASYNFTQSNVSGIGKVSDVLLLISHSANNGTSSLNFPSSWRNIGSGWPTSINGNTIAVLWLRSIDTSSVIGTFNYSGANSSASYAITASFALNGGTGGSNLATGSLVPITASQAISASFAPSAAPANYTSSLFGTASWANNSVNATSASFASSIVTASFASNYTRELTTGSTYQITSSWANSSASASFAPGATYTSSLFGTASWANSASTAVSSSIAAVGSSPFSISDGTITKAIGTGFVINTSIQSVQPVGFIGTASAAVISTTATNANNVNIGTTLLNANHGIPLVTGTGNVPENIDANTNLSYNPASASLLLNNGTLDFMSAVKNDNILIYHSTTNKYGFGIASSEARYFTPEYAHISIGYVTSSNGSTFTEYGRFDATQKGLTINGVTASLLGTASWASNSLNANSVFVGSTTVPAIPYGVLLLSGSANVTQIAYTGSLVYTPSTQLLTVTSSWANNAVSASFAPSSLPGTTLNTGSIYLITSSWANNSKTASTVQTGDIIVGGATASFITWDTNNVAAPTVDIRSAGSKLILYPNVGSGLVDYALGINGGTLWYSVPNSASIHQWYGGTSSMMTLSNNVLTVTSLVGTASRAVNSSNSDLANFATTAGSAGSATTCVSATTATTATSASFATNSSTSSYNSNYVLKSGDSVSGPLILQTAASLDCGNSSNGIRLLGSGPLPKATLTLPNDTSFAVTLVTGSTFTFTGSLLIATASQAISASFAPGSVAANYTSSLFGTASWATKAISASFAPGSAAANYTSSLFGTASWANFSNSGSVTATTANSLFYFDLSTGSSGNQPSYVDVGLTFNPSTNQISGSALGFTGSLLGTSSFSTRATSASFAPGSAAATYTSSLFGTASWANNAISASWSPTVGTYQRLNSTFSTTNATATNTNLSVAVGANTAWICQAKLTGTAAAANNYLYQVSIPANATLEGWVTCQENGQNPTTFRLAANSLVGPLQVIAGGTGNDILQFSTNIGNTAGNITIAAASNGAGSSMSVLSGSTFSVIPATNV